MSTPPLGTRARSVHVTANGIRQHYLDYSGDGPPLLIVAGITMPAACVEFVALPLAQRHRVISVDPRGRGLSEQPASGYALTDYADDLAALIEAIGLERPIVLGHSMGARIAAALAVYHPEAVGSADPRRPPADRAWPRPLPRSPRPLRRFAAQGPGGGDRGRHAARVPDLAGRTPRAARAVARHLQRDGRRRDIREFPHRRPARAAAEDPGSGAVRVRRREPVVPAAPCPSCEGCCPGARFAAVERAGHMIPGTISTSSSPWSCSSPASGPAAPDPVVDRWAARCQHVRIPQPPSRLAPEPRGGGGGLRACADRDGDRADRRRGRRGSSRSIRAFATLVDRPQGRPRRLNPGELLAGAGDPRRLLSESTGQLGVDGSIVVCGESGSR